MSQQTAETLENRMVNGVDVGRLFETIDAVKGEPGIARFKFRSTNRWINGGNNQARINGFYGALQEHSRETDFELEIDEPPVLLGEDKGPNPVEYLLAGLSGCLTSSLIFHAAARGITIRGVESRLEGDLDLRGFLGISKDVRVGYENIRVYFKIDADISDADKQELIQMAKKYSPVFNTVANPTDVTVELDKD